MASAEDAQYRLKLSRGFLIEARQDIALRRWRSCVDNSQLVVENAAKSTLALLGPVGRTHKVADLLRQHLSSFPPSALSQTSRLIELAEQMGWDVHVSSDYGNEADRRTPWEIFDETSARRALTLAEEALVVAEQLTAGPLDTGT